MLAWRWSNMTEIYCHSKILIFIHCRVWTVTLKHFVLLFEFLDYLISWLITNSLRWTGTMDLVLWRSMEKKMHSVLFLKYEIYKFGRRALQLIILLCVIWTIFHLLFWHYHYKKYEIHCSKKEFYYKIKMIINHFFYLQKRQEGMIQTEPS
jgi:hypothetical protein